MRTHTAEHAAPARSDAEKADILRAKTVLMDRQHMSEPEAHRYLQKTSMDASRSMAETARMILLFAGM